MRPLYRALTAKAMRATLGDHIISAEQGIDPAYLLDLIRIKPVTMALP